MTEFSSHRRFAAICMGIFKSGSQVVIEVAVTRQFENIEYPFEYFGMHINFLFCSLFYQSSKPPTSIFINSLTVSH